MNRYHFFPMVNKNPNTRIKLIALTLSVIILLPAANLCAQGSIVSKQADTIFVGSPLSNAKLISNLHTRFSLLIYASNTYKSIKFLNREVTVSGNQIRVVQKLYNGTDTNIDSVIVNSKTLMPIESHSDINTAIDSFTYNANKVSGTTLVKTPKKKDTLIKIDTSFSKPLFNGLIYMETYQALSYQKNQPFYLAEYVPGHNTKFTRIEYIKDEDVSISGVTIAAKVLEMKIGKITLYCWLNAKNQELLKIEAKFPGFNYYMLRML